MMAAEVFHNAKVFAGWFSRKQQNVEFFRFSWRRHKAKPLRLFHSEETNHLP